MDWTLPVQANKRFMIALCHGTCAWVLFFSDLCPLAWIHRRIRVARSVTYASSRNKRNFFIIPSRSSSCLHTLIAQLLNWQDHLPSCPNTGWIMNIYCKPNLGGPALFLRLEITIGWIPIQFSFSQEKAFFVVWACSTRVFECFFLSCLLHRKPQNRSWIKSCKDSGHGGFCFLDWEGEWIMFSVKSSNWLEGHGNVQRLPNSGSMAASINRKIDKTAGEKTTNSKRISILAYLGKIWQIADPFLSFLYGNGGCAASISISWWIEAECATRVAEVLAWYGLALISIWTLRGCIAPVTAAPCPWKQAYAFRIDMCVVCMITQCLRANKYT